MSKAPPDEVVELIIRFTASIPDLPLTISSPRTTTFLALKIQIREHLPTDLSKNRLRLIFSGKVLDDTSPLSTLLKGSKPPPPPPPPKSNKAKGKEPVRENESRSSTPGLSQKIYIHCSIGDELSSADLQDEATLATSTAQKLLSNIQTPDTKTQANKDQNNNSIPHTTAAAATTTTPRPLGFDRLLTTGFTPQDIATLRASFLTTLSHTHTPDTLPHGDALRLLEDRWLDSSANDTQTADGTALDDDEASALDDMFWGNVFGFFWPIGALVWGFREEGVWTRRRQIAVFTGLAVNLVFGFARLSNSR
jgi:hypothetical protein